MTTVIVSGFGSFLLVFVCWYNISLKLSVNPGFPCGRTHICLVSVSHTSLHHETRWDQRRLADWAGVCFEGPLKRALNPKAQLEFPWTDQLYHPELFPGCSCRQWTWNRPKLAFNAKSAPLLNWIAQSQTEIYVRCLKVGEKGNWVGYTCSIC